MLYVSRYLGIEVFHTGREIFRYGDYGDKMYIILKGRVSIHIPNKEKKKLKAQLKKNPGNKLTGVLMRQGTKGEKKLSPAQVENLPDFIEVA